MQKSKMKIKTESKIENANARSSRQSSRQSSKLGIFMKKYASLILVTMFTLAIVTVSFAWFNGIRFSLVDERNIEISKASSLYDNVDILGYSFDENGNLVIDNPVEFMTTDEVNEVINNGNDPNNKAFFAGDRFEPGALNKLDPSDSDYLTQYYNVINENTNTKYIRVVNRSNLDISVKIQFQLEANQDVNDLSAFWYVATDVTSHVNKTAGATSDAKLKNYAEANKASRLNEFNENNPNTKVFTNLTTKVKLGEIMENKVLVDGQNPGNVCYYRIDYGLAESALKASGVDYFGKSLKCNIYIFYGQVNAPDDDDIVAYNEVREIWNADDLKNALMNVNEAYNGDTLKFMADIEVTGDLNVIRPLNFDLNGHRLTINHGNLNVNHSSTIPMTFNLTKTGSILINGTTGPNAIAGNFVMNTPNSTITITGDNATSAGKDYYDIRLSGYIIDGVGTGYETDGLKLESTYIVKYKFNELQGNVEVDDLSRVKITDGAKLTVGEFVNVDVVSTDEITAAYVDNYGTVGWMNFGSMRLSNSPSIKLRVYNNGYIGGASESGGYGITLPSSSRVSNTQIIKGPLSNNFTITGSTYYTDSNITDETVVEYYVKPIKGEDSAYEVFLVPNTPTTNNSMLKYVFANYFESSDQYASIKKLVIFGRKGVYLNENDTDFLMSKTGDGGFVFRDLNYIDMSGISIEQTNYVPSEYKNNRIKNNAFMNKTNLSTFILPSDLVYIGANAFKGTALSKVTIPSNVIDVGKDAFIGVHDITIMSPYPVATISNFLRGFSSSSYFFVDELFVDTYKESFSHYTNGNTFKKHVYCYAEPNGDYYIRILDPELRNLEIVAYIGDYSISSSICPNEYLFEGITYHVTSIGRDAYINITNVNTLSNLNIGVGTNTTHIGREAFLNLDAIGVITLPSVTSIDYRAFSNCQYLKKVYLYGACRIGEEAFYKCTSLEDATLDSTLTLGPRSFADCRVLRNLIIPKVNMIGDGAFRNCTAFEYVELGELDSIDSGTFNNCINLHTVVLSPLTTTIGDNAFEGCVSLKTITTDKDIVEENEDYLLLDEITIIGSEAFKGCRTFKYLVAPVLTEIRDNAFRNCNSLEYAILPSIVTIDDYAFYKLPALTMMEMENVSNIGEYAFYDTPLLYSFIPNAINIGDYAFANCNQIKAISLGNATSMGNKAFDGVQPYYVDFSSYIFPEDISDVPDELSEAYGGRQNWHDFNEDVRIYFKSNEERNSDAQLAKRHYFYSLFALCSTDNSGSYNGNLEERFLHDKYEFIGDWIFTSSDYDSVNNIGISKNIYTYNVYTMGDPGSLQGELLTYHGRELVGNSVIPYKEYLPDGITDLEGFNDKTSNYYSGVIDGITITKIGDYAFQSVRVSSTDESYNTNGDRFSYVVFANSVREIGKGSFIYSKLNFVDCNNVEVIGDSAFRNNTELRYVDLGNTVEIGPYAFSSFVSATISNRTYTTMSAAYGATNGYFKPVFTSTKLTKVVFNHVDVIDEGAFFFDVGSNGSLCILDMSNNQPGLVDSYDLGFGPNHRYNRPTECDLYWLGYRANRVYYQDSSENRSDVYIIAPYFEEEVNSIRASFLQVIPKEMNLLNNYDYIYDPDYEINNVKVGMFMLTRKSNESNDLTGGFTIYRSFVRNIGVDTNLEGLSVIDSNTNRYLYTVPSELSVNKIYDKQTGKYLSDASYNIDVDTINCDIASYSFKSSTVKSGFTCDLSFGPDIQTIASYAFIYSHFRTVYTGEATRINNYAFYQSSVLNLHLYRVEYIGANVFYESNFTAIDLRENKTIEGETIYCDFSNSFLDGSNISSIYINKDDLSTYVSRTKGIINRTGDLKQYIEIYAYFRVVGTHIGHLDLYFNDTYNLESILSPYTIVTDTTYQEVVWTSSNSSVIDVVNGEVVIKEDPESALHLPFTSGQSTIYCIKYTKNKSNDQVVGTELLGKFIVDIITRNDTKMEMYNFSVSDTKVNNQYVGYSIYSYTGTLQPGIFDPTVAFDDFMDTYAVTISGDEDYLDENNQRVLKLNNSTDYKVYDIELSAYWKAKIINDEPIYLYADENITKIGDYSFYRIPFNEIWLENVRTVGRRAFSNESTVKNLKKVVMPMVEVIEYQSFYGNTLLEDVIIGQLGVSNLRRLEEEAFKNCIKLSHFAPVFNNFSYDEPYDTEEELGYRINNYSYKFVGMDETFYSSKVDMYDFIGEFDRIDAKRVVNKYNEETHQMEEITIEPYYGIIWCYGYYYNQYTTQANVNGTITEHVIRNVDRVFEFMMEEGTKKNIYLPDSLVNMGIGVFQNCSSIEQIRMPMNETFTTVPNYTFYGCKNLHYVRLPENIVTIGEYAFQNCENLNSAVYFNSEDYEIVYDENNQEIEDQTLHLVSTRLRDGEGTVHKNGIDLNGVVTINKYAFVNCYVLDNISLNKVKTIGERAFYSCESLSVINFEGNEATDNVSFGSLWNDVTSSRKRYYVTEQNKQYLKNAKYLYVRDIEIGDYLVQRIINTSTGEIRGFKIVAYNGDIMPQIPEKLYYDGNEYPVLTIGSYAYQGINRLSDEIRNYQVNGNSLPDTVVLPKFVSTVESNAFSDTVFKHYIESFDSNNIISVAYGSEVFKGNILLEDATFTRMVTGGSKVFDGCTSFKVMDLTENYNSNNVYYAPVINDDFFSGSPTKAVCHIKADKIEMFRAVGYQGRVFESSSTEDDTHQYQILPIDASTASIIRYIGEASISGVSGTYTIPETLTVNSNTYNIVKVGVGAFKDVNVVGGTSLVIPEGITEIGEYGFYGTGFANISFANRDNHDVIIGTYAFANMKSLVSADLSQINTISSTHIFDGDLYIGSVELPQSNQFVKVPDYTFNNCTNLNRVKLSSFVREIGDSAFRNCTSLNTMANNSSLVNNIVEINLINKIGDYAFDGCMNLGTVNAVTCNNVGSYVFRDCTNLSIINLKNDLANFVIGEGVFYNCTSLSSVVEYTTYIPDYTYYGCTNLRNINLANARSVGKYAFYGCTNLDIAYLGQTLEVYERAFYGCSNLATVDLGSTQIIHNYAFANCVKLSGVDFSNVTDVGNYAFSNADFSGVLDLKAIVNLGDYAFQYNTGLTEIQFKNVNKIGQNAFAYNNNITTFDFTLNKRNGNLSAPGTVDYRSLNNISSDFYIYIPDDSYFTQYASTSANSTFKFSAWKNRIYEYGIQIGDYIVKEVTIGDVTGYQIIRYVGGKLPAVYTVPAKLNGIDVISIGRFAFYNQASENSDVEVLNLGTNIVKVADSAFQNYQFGTISMPSVKTIGSYAFSGNKNLGYLSLPEVTTIGAYAFSDCNNLKVVRLYDTIFSIGNYAFSNCEDLRNVYFESTDPTTITFGQYAFGTLAQSNVYLRVPNGEGVLAAYKARANLTVYADRIKAGEINEADFSYRVSIEGYDGVNPIYGVEIISYEGQSTSVAIPATIEVVIGGDTVEVDVVRILDYAFENALNLSVIDLPNTLKYISSHAFMGSSSITSITTSTYTQGTSTFRAVDGILYMVDDSGRFTTLVYYPINRSGSSYNFTRTGLDLSTITTIYENAFYGNTYINEIVVPATVRFIGENAFGYMPALTILEFSAPISGSVTVPTLYGSNILTNCNSDLVIVVSSSAYNLFKNDIYFGYYKNRLATSRPSGN